MHRILEKNSGEGVGSANYFFFYKIILKDGINVKTDGAQSGCFFFETKIFT